MLGVMERGIVLIFIPLLTLSTDVMSSVATVDATGYSIPLLEGWQPIVLVYNLVNED